MSATNTPRANGCTGHARHHINDNSLYSDPPYHGHPDYKHNLVLEDYVEMAKILSSIKGKFILSINDNPDMRQAFKSFNIKPVSLLYSVGIKPTKAQELIITNF